MLVFIPSNLWKKISYSSPPKSPHQKRGSININYNDEIYVKAFGDNLVVINNDPKDADKSFDPQEIKRRFFDTSKAKGKPKTPEEIEKTKADVAQLNKDIELALQQTPKFTPASKAVAKIKAFIKW